MIDNTKEISPTLIKTSIEDYIKILVAANEHVEAHEAYFYHFLQPTLFTKKNLNEYEHTLFAKGAPFVTAQSVQAFTSAYPIIVNKLDTVKFSHSLTAAFDELTESPYLDFCHITHIGNKIIAENIWNNISNELKF